MDAQANHLNVVDDWIYFSDLTDRNYCISKARTDGTDIMKLTDDLSSFLNISDGWIFYTNESEENKLYKMRLDGSEKIKLSEDVVNSPNVVGEEIYYIKFDGDFYYYNYGTENGKLYKIKTYGGGRSIMIPVTDNLENQEVTLVHL